MVNLFSSFRKIRRQPVMVIGDLMLDTYTIGKARRISPEAPVPVLHVHSEEHRPGGAGNVALNLISMGADVLMVGRVGSDDHGTQLIHSLESKGVKTHGIWTQTDCQTPVKNRIIADNQQMVRVDYETVTPLHEAIEQQIIEALPQLLESIQVVAISDYGKGMITKTLMSAVMEACHERAIPVIVDPKGLDFSKYKKATIVKPNLGEVYAAANLPLEVPLETAAQKVLETTQAEVLMVTRSENGISLFYQTGKREDFPVRRREVTDVTGAGDTVLATLTMAMANKLSISDSLIPSFIDGVHRNVYLKQPILKGLTLKPPLGGSIDEEAKAANLALLKINLSDAGVDAEKIDDLAENLNNLVFELAGNFLSKGTSANAWFDNMSALFDLINENNLS